MSEIAEVKETIDRLGRAWEEFKSVNDRKGATDVEQLSKINAALDKTTDRLDDLEKRLNRPGAGGGQQHDAWREKPETKAFFAYARRGLDAIGDDEKKALTIGDSAQAGYLAPPEFAQEIIKGITDMSPIRQIARVRPMSRSELQIPKRTGQFAAVRVAETGTRAETTGQTYGLTTITAPEMYARVEVSNHMLEDSAFDLEAELRMEMTDQFAVLEGQESVSGTGVGQLEGILINDDVAETNSGSAATIADANGQADGLLTLKYGIKTGYAANARWALNRTTMGSVRKLKDANNQYIWQPGIALGQPPTIDGDPYVEFPDMPSEAAGAYPVLYGDFMRAYSVGDRVTMEVLRDPFSKMTEGKVVFHGRRRVGGQVTLAEAIRKLKCAA